MNSLVIPKVDNAQLPANYEAAKQALQQCSSIDECKDWSDKALALASYARQAHDDHLVKMSQRIQGRAIRRCGELLKQIEPQSKYNAKKREDGADPSFSRKQAAQDAGMSERQAKNALRVAMVPEPEFEEAIESDDPPTVTKLAEMGTKKRPLNELRPAEFKRATQALGTLRRFAEFCEKDDPIFVARGVNSHEVDEASHWVSIIDAWMDSFVTNLEK